MSLKLGHSQQGSFILSLNYYFHIKGNSPISARPEWEKREAKRGKALCYLGLGFYWKHQFLVFLGSQVSQVGLGDLEDPKKRHRVKKQGRRGQMNMFHSLHCWQRPYGYRLVLLLRRWGNWGSVRWCDLLKSSRTQLIRRRAEIWTQVFLSPLYVFCPDVCIR